MSSSIERACRDLRRKPLEPRAMRPARSPNATAKSASWIIFSRPAAGICGKPLAIAVAAHLGPLVRLVGRTLQRQGGADPRWAFACANCPGCCRARRSAASPSTTSAANASELPGETERLCQGARLRQPQPASEQRRRPGAPACSRRRPNASICRGRTARPDRRLTQLVFWHHWPDSKLHDGSGAGQGLDALTRDIADATDRRRFLGVRRAPGHRPPAGHHLRPWLCRHRSFPDADDEQASFLKRRFKSGRSYAGRRTTPAPLCRPSPLQINSPHGAHLSPSAAGNGRARAATPRSRMAACRCWKCCALRRTHEIRNAR